MFIITLTLVMTCISCNQKGMCYDDEDLNRDAIVEVNFLWDDADRINIEGMSTFFYPHDSDGKIWDFEIAGKNGGLISVPRGRYTVVAINNDSPGVDISFGPTPSSVAINARYYDDKTLRPSGMIYGGIADTNVFNPTEFNGCDQCSTTPQQTITIYPDSLTVVYNVRLTDISQPDRIESMQASLSGLAVTMDLAGRRIASPTAAVLNIPIEKDTREDEMFGKSTGLGTPSESPHFTLTLYAKLSDSAKTAKSITFDVTDQILNAEDPHNIFITLSGINFVDPEPDDDVDVGMDVDVDGWSIITIDLITGK